MKNYFCVCAVLSELYNFYAFTALQNKKRGKSKITKTQKPKSAINAEKYQPLLFQKITIDL